MTDLTHPQELKHTRHLLSEQKMGNTGNDYINRAIDTIDQLVAEKEALSEYAFEATKSIVGLTAGGSEFFAGKLPDGRYKADLPYCVKYVRDSKEADYKRRILAALKEV